VIFNCEWWISSESWTCFYPQHLYTGMRWNSKKGRGFGTVVGSVLVSRFGLRQIYRAFGITAGTAAILYFCSYHWWLKRIEEMRLAAKEGLNPVGGIENPALEIEDHGPSNHIPNQMKLATTELWLSVLTCAISCAIRVDWQMHIASVIRTVMESLLEVMQWYGGHQFLHSAPHYHFIYASRPAPAENVLL